MMGGGEGDSSHQPSFFEAHEIDVANILLEIPSIISQEESRSLNWAAKRKRKRTVPKSPPLEAAVANSPTSPLGLSLSQFDDKKLKIKLTFRKLHSKQRKRRKELLEDIDTLTGKLCKSERDLEDGMNQYKKLMAINLALKAKRDEEYLRLKMEQPQMDVDSGLILGMKQYQFCYIPIVITTTHHQIQDVIKDQGFCGSQMGEDFAHLHDQVPLLLPFSKGLGKISSSNGGSPELIDLNVSQKKAYNLDTYQPQGMTVFLDSSKILAASKRKERMFKMKQKKQLALKLYNKTAETRANY